MLNNFRSFNAHIILFSNFSSLFFLLLVRHGVWTTHDVNEWQRSELYAVPINNQQSTTTITTTTMCMMQQCTLKQLQQTFQIPTSTATIPAPVHTRLSTDVNQSGEIDVKDFELAIEVSVDKNKKKKTGVWFGNSLPESYSFISEARTRRRTSKKWREHYVMWHNTWEKFICMQIIDNKFVVPHLVPFFW